jgi:putative transposase
MDAGEVNNRNSEFQFWRQDNQPKEVYSPAFVFQKLSYIHNNPVEAGIVTKAEYYLYSSAMDYYIAVQWIIFRQKNVDCLK